MTSAFEGKQLNETSESNVIFVRFFI